MAPSRPQDVAAVLNAAANLTEARHVNLSLKNAPGFGGSATANGAYDFGSSQGLETLHLGDSGAHEDQQLVFSDGTIYLQQVKPAPNTKPWIAFHGPNLGADGNLAAALNPGLLVTELLGTTSASRDLSLSGHGSTSYVVTVNLTQAAQAASGPSADIHRAAIHAAATDPSVKGGQVTFHVSITAEGAISSIEVGQPLLGVGQLTLDLGQKAAPPSVVAPDPSQVSVANAKSGLSISEDVKPHDGDSS